MSMLPVGSQKGFNFFKPDLSPMTLTTLSRALSQINRYNGGTLAPISVAQHMVIGTRMIIEMVGGITVDAKQFATHDAHEVIVGDMQTTLRKLFFMFYFRMIEQRWERAFYQFHGLPLHMTPLVKEVDKRMWITESKYLAPELYERYGHLGRPFEIEIISWTPARAEIEYFMLYRELFGDDYLKA